MLYLSLLCWWANWFLTFFSLKISMIAMGMNKKYHGETTHSKQSQVCYVNEIL